MGERTITVVEDRVVAGDEAPREGSKFHTFPSLTTCSDGSYLCTTLVGSEKSGPDGRTRAFKSTDSGASWGPMPSPTKWDEQTNARWGYLMCHIVETSPGHLLAAYVRSDRFNPDEPIFHPKTDGMQHTQVRLSESEDGGRTWSRTRDLDFTLPDLIVPGRFIRLPNGWLGMPCEVWHEWDKGFVQGPSARLILSRDNGKTWPEAGVIAREEAGRLLYGDPRLTLMPDGRLVALMWTHDLTSGQDLPVHRAESSDMGLTWCAAQQVGITGQIASPASLGEGLMLAAYQKRFGADAGLWAVLSYDGGLSWDAETDTVLWAAGEHTKCKNPFSGYQEYTFGYSTVLPLPGREVLVPFWASNGRTTCVRLLRVRIG